MQWTILYHVVVSFINFVSYTDFIENYVLFEYRHENNCCRPSWNSSLAVLCSLYRSLSHYLLRYILNLLRSLKTLILNVRGLLDKFMCNPPRLSKFTWANPLLDLYWLCKYDMLKLRKLFGRNPKKKVLSFDSCTINKNILW